MNCDIENIYSEILDHLPSEDGMEEVLISKGVLPVPKDIISTDLIAISKGIHEYGCLNVDQLAFHANKRTYRGLGLLIFSVMFSNKSELTLNITHQKSSIKTIKIKFDKPKLKNVLPGFTSKPFAFSYWPSEIEKHPWLHSGHHETDLPYFLFTNKDDFCATQEDRNKRDIIEGFGSDIGCSLFAELLLNIGRNEEKKERIVLECDAGYRGVAPASAEIQLWIAENDDYSAEYL